MNAIRSLTSLEYSRHRAWSLRTNPRYSLAGCLVLVIAGVWMSTTGAIQNHILLFMATFLFVVASSVVSAISVTLSVQGGERDWWISYPHPRLHLILAKWLSALRLSVRLGYLIALSTVVTYLIHFASNSPSGVDVSFIAQAWPWVIVAVAAAPVSAALGTASILFSVGWWRVLGGVPMLLAMAWFAPIIITAPGHSVYNVTTHSVLVSALWVAVVGWPIALVFLLVSPVGIRRLGSAHVRSFTLLSEGVPTRFSGAIAASVGDVALNSAAAGDVARVEDRDRPHILQALPRFWVLVALEWTRFRWLGRSVSPVIRVICWGVLASLLIGGFISAFWHDAMIYAPTALFDMFGMGMTIAAILIRQTDPSKGRLIWWMTFPGSRTQLTFARFLGTYSALLAYASLGMIAFFVGVAVHGVLYPIPSATLSMCGAYVVRAALLAFVGSGVIQLLFEIVPALFRGWRMILFLPLYGLGYNGVNFLFMRWVFADGSDVQLNPHFWPYFAWLVVIGIPLGIACLAYGARFQHMYLQVRAMRWNRR